MINSNINAKLNKYLSTVAIKNDVETLYELGSSIKGLSPIISIGLMQYYSLFCYEYECFLKKTNIDVSIQNNSGIRISDERNSIKLFNERYSKCRNQIIAIDTIHDNYFKSKLKFPFFAIFNRYYNLGIFFTEDNQVIGNTQLFSYIMNDKKQTRAFFDSQTYNSFSYEVATVIKSIKTGLDSFLPGYKPVVTVDNIVVKYKDYNTNRLFATFRGITRYNKELTLRILHILCSLGFFKYIIGRFVSSDNIWCMRIKYITLYYSIKSVDKLKEKYPQLFEWHNKNIWFVSSRFRNCMMHYDFSQNGESVIKEECLDLKKPFFGLVESCFDGKNYTQLNEALDEEINQIISRLNSILVIDL